MAVGGVGGGMAVLAFMAVALGIRRQSSLESSKLSLEQTNHRFDAALKNMTHGLCMFDTEKRLVVWNDRYAKMYRLPPELLRVGATHQEIIAHRVKNGILAGESSTAAAGKKLNELGQLSSSEISSRVYQLADGRLVRVIRQPVKGGGWGALHEDITENASRAAKEKRRPEVDLEIRSFREKVETILTSVKDGAAALKSVAAELSTSPHPPSPPPPRPPPSPKKAT